ncbi:hypothetical protein BDV96DRAFT_566152 [Lophiotrema nucula]|uniref:Restriction endonuclease domain-containing protein n=1 Tax=Lophiotrema nucula TaxID=690887 RepID=A0A6A5ZLV4_9PLEO|nr:hypothetical protein BDV96DRAFT_566152 [Lophiotrema nucula]
MDWSESKFSRDEVDRCSPEDPRVGPQGLYPDRKMNEVSAVLPSGLLGATQEPSAKALAHTNGNHVHSGAQHNFSQVPPANKSEPSSTSNNIGFRSSSINQIIRDIEEIRQGTTPLADGQASPSYRLSEREYGELERRIALDTSLKAFAEEQLRFNYSKRTGYFTIKMTGGPKHENTVGGVVNALKLKIENLRNSENSKHREFAHKINLNKTTGAVKLKECKYVPDILFQHKSCRRPGVIIEVADTQTPKELAVKAWEYLVYSCANIQVVYGIDIQNATLSSWRYRIDNDTLVAYKVLDGKPFRDSDGPVADTSLVIRLKDFARASISEAELGEDGDYELILTAGDLCRILEDAEQDEKLGKRYDDDISSGDDFLPDAVMLGKMPPWPGESLLPNDEEKYTKLEEDDENRSAGKDADYVDAKRRVHLRNG